MLEGEAVHESVCTFVQENKATHFWLVVFWGSVSLSGTIRKFLAFQSSDLMSALMSEVGGMEDSSTHWFGIPVWVIVAASSGILKKGRTP